MLACEDHTLDQYIVRPVISALLADLGRPSADVRVITNPRIQGISNLKAKACSILERYSLISALVIFIVDCDCEDGQNGRLDRYALFRNLLDNCSNHDTAALVVARQEVEVWALWGSRSNLGVSWQTVVRERHPKERFFEPLTTPADNRVPGRGRQRLIALSLDQGLRSLCSGCPELKDLQDEIRERLGL
jgi:hypothetical protein